jgi:serine protease Do
MESFDPQDFGLDEHLPPPRPTTPPVRRGFLMVLGVLCLVAAVVYGVPYVAEQTGYAWEAGRSKAASEALAKLEKAGVTANASALFRMATVKVSPAVVNIQAFKFGGGNEVLGVFGGGGRFNRREAGMSVGSGAVIDRQRGYIVTNNHVVNDADRITVRLSEGAEVRARLVGADPKTDLAVLQVSAPLKVAAEWGDSNKLSIGDWVLAIGSPYMLDHTVTIGIVSATGRNNLRLPGMDESAYQDFIQTDAAINPGNSGGPLVDINGRVVGINTAILTASSFLRGDDVIQSGGFEGIGLAIPSDMARKVVDSLIKNGKVVRGFLGVGIQPLTPEMARGLKLPNTHGALIAGVQPGSPADKAGLQTGDVIVALAGKDIPDPTTLRLRTAETEPGTEVQVDYYRGGARHTTKVVVGELGGGQTPPALRGLGFHVIEAPPAQGRRSPQLIIDQVYRGSLAARAGLRPGFRVLAVGSTEVNTLAEFEKAVAAADPAQGLTLRVRSPDGQTFVLTLGGEEQQPNRGR